MKKKILVIIAHPDDETIWMGCTLLRNINKWNLTIISLCRRKDKDRAPKFKKVCKIYGAKCFMSDLEDDKLNHVPVNEAIKRIKKYAGKKYDYIFTHGKNGEYGHIRHRDVHKAVNEMLRKKSLSCKELICFSYWRKGKYAYPKKNSDRFIYFNKSLLKKKKSIIEDVYGFGKKSFESVCCRNAEAFNIRRLT